MRKAVMFNFLGIRSRSPKKLPPQAALHIGIIIITIIIITTTTATNNNNNNKYSARTIRGVLTSSLKYYIFFQA
jgi:hypothetical protein